jgi:UBX domain-containing protein 1/4
MLKDAAAE